MSDDYSMHDEHVPEAYTVQPVRSRRWLWWLLGIIGGFIVLVCGGVAALGFWASSHKSTEIYNVTAQRQGPSIVIRLTYDIKNRPHTIPSTRVVIEGPGWKHQQTAFGMGMVPYTGQITAIVPPNGIQPKPGGTATV